MEEMLIISTYLEHMHKSGCLIQTHTTCNHRHDVKLQLFQSRDIRLQVFF